MSNISTYCKCKWDYGYKVSFYLTHEIKQFFDTNSFPNTIGNYAYDHFFVNKSIDRTFERDRIYSVEFSYNNQAVVSEFINNK